MDQLRKGTQGQATDIALPISSSTCHYYTVTCPNREWGLGTYGSTSQSKQRSDEAWTKYWSDTNLQTRGLKAAIKASVCLSACMCF